MARGELYAKHQSGACRNHLRPMTAFISTSNVGAAAAAAAPSDDPAAIKETHRGKPPLFVVEVGTKENHHQGKPPLPRKATTEESRQRGKTPPSWKEREHFIFLVRRGFLA
ncbi:unnamed protein product, partial [Pylaiella littoralis]